MYNHSYLAIARGHMPGASIVSLFGRNEDVDNLSLPEDVWQGGGEYIWPSAATAMEIVSTSTDDAAAGTGIRTVLVDGLDASYSVVQQTVTLNGTTPVALGNLLRINGVIAVTAGSQYKNVGVITVRAVSGAQVYASMAVGTSRAQQAIYTVPLGYVAYVAWLGSGIQKNTVDYIELSALVRPFGGAWQVGTNVTVSSQSPHVVVDRPIFPPLPPRMDARVTAMAASSVNLVATASVQLLLIKQDLSW